MPKYPKFTAKKRHVPELWRRRLAETFGWKYSDLLKSGVKAMKLVIGQWQKFNSIGQFSDFEQKYGGEDENI